MRRILAAAVVSLGAIAPLGAQPADAAVERAVNAYSKMKTVRATFEQTMVNPLTGSEVVARGEFLRQQPNLVAIRFTDPEGDLVVADGRVVWIYLPSSNPGQALRMPLTGQTPGMVDLTAQFLDRPRERYHITDGGPSDVDGRAARAVILVPKDAGQPFTKATVWVDDADGMIRRFEITEPTGLTRTVRLLTIRVNGPVQRSAFTFTPPQGVEVVDQTGGA